jgi:uncharacterized membrane protein YqjE
VIGETNASRGSVSDAVVEIVNEVKQFVRTRYQMLRMEVKENMATWRRVALLGALALVLLITAWLLFSLALVAVIAAAFYPSPYAWFLGFIIMTAVWGAGAGILALLAKHEMKAQDMYPKQTMETLKEDQVWVQNELGNDANGNIENVEDNSSRAA